MTSLKTRERQMNLTNRPRPEPVKSPERMGGYLRIVTNKKDEVRYGGLCVLCNLRDTCTFPRSTDRPVMTCDEFDGLNNNIRLHVMGPSHAQAPSQDGSRDDAGKTEPGVWGLCTTCVKRDSCDFPRPDGGVWQCEEFE